MVRVPLANDSYEVRKKAAWFSSWPFFVGKGEPALHIRGRIRVRAELSSLGRAEAFGAA